MRRNPECYEFINENFKQDKNCFIIAGRRNEKVFKKAPSSMRNDEFINSVIRKRSNLAEFNSDLSENSCYVSEVV